MSLFFSALRRRLCAKADLVPCRTIQDTRILLTVSNLTHLRETSIPRLINQFQVAFKVDMAADVQMLMDVTDQLDKILFDDYVKRKSADVAKIIRKGVLGGTVNWYEAAKPTGELRLALWRYASSSSSY